ncbi:MAG TPA: YqgE/AlgH family protein [Candidatus Binataceae bacterium]|nr:YqgE/AlgH family protein [Candidatus Binataceae bacterium]
MPDEKPYFLVASPDMGDPVFRHSVIMMIPPDQVHLRAGVIINEPTATSAYEIFPHLSALKDTPTSAYYGGPVDDGRPTLALRSATPPGKATQLFQDVYVSTDADTISQIVKGHPANLRIFFGRAQWLDEQLHYEILQGAWYVMPADADEAFSADPTHLWHKLVERGRLQEAHYLFPFGDTPR